MYRTLILVNTEASGYAKKKGEVVLALMDRQEKEASLYYCTTLFRHKWENKFSEMSPTWWRGMIICEGQPMKIY